MKITHNNYEAYALDYLEGNLTVDQQMAFETFLDTHPGIREDLSGIDQVVLKPDTSTIYPDKSSLYRKESAGIIPLWGVSRLVAAAIAILLVSTATFFVWKSVTQPSNLDSSSITDYSGFENNEQNLPATRTPMPENVPSSAISDRNTDAEQPETNVMAQNGNVSDRPANIRPASPALTSGNENVHLQMPAEEPIEFREASEVSPVNIPDSDDGNAETALTEINNSLAMDTHNEDAVSFLPVKIPVEISSKSIVHGIAFNNTDSFKSFGTSADRSIKIHIPGDFLSDTWTDVSVASFKKKLIPQFIKNQLNL